MRHSSYVEVERHYSGELKVQIEVGVSLWLGWAQAPKLAHSKYLARVMSAAHGIPLFASRRSSFLHPYGGREMHEQRSKLRSVYKEDLVGSQPSESSEKRKRPCT